MIRHLNEQYKCPKTGKRCKMENCTQYKNCNLNSKKNYKAWKDAFHKDKREILEQLSRGGL